MFVVTFFNFLAFTLTTIDFDMDVEDVLVFIRDLPPHISPVAAGGDDFDGVHRILSQGHIDLMYV